jgi:hypothetical protein
VGANGSTKSAKAVELLTSFLADGEHPVAELQEHAKQQGLSWATIRCAADTLGVEKRRKGFGRDGAWIWAIPALRAVDLLSPAKPRAGAGHAERWVAREVTWRTPRKGQLASLHDGRPRNSRASRHPCPAELLCRSCRRRGSSYVPLQAPIKRANRPFAHFGVLKADPARRLARAPSVGAGPNVKIVQLE